MRRLVDRRTLPVATAVALVAMAAVALAGVGGAPGARAAAIASSGSIQIANSREGTPIFSAAGIAPGGTATGTVTIENEGSGPIALELHRGELVDLPGAGGGVLSGRLQLTVADVTGAPTAVYSGPLATMPDLPAGELAAGEARTYRFTASLPDGGSASFQNAVQGAATTVAYSWVASEATRGEEGGGSGGSGGGAPGGGSGSSGGGAPPSGGGTSGAQTLGLTVPKVRRSIRGGRLVAWTNCDRACRLSVRGRIRATVAGQRRVVRFRFTRPGLLQPGARRLRIPIPRGLRGWIASTPGRARLRARLRFLAIGAAGERATVRRTVALRARPPAPPPTPGQTPPQAGAPG